LPAAFLGHTVARCMTAICGATMLAVCRDAETDPRVERHTATGLTLWAIGSCRLSLTIGNSPAHVVRARVHAWGASASTSLVERSRAERAEARRPVLVGQVGKRLRTGLRSKRSTPAPCASANVWHLHVGYFRTVSSV
jgi:hypothetical protein